MTGVSDIRVNDCSLHVRLQESAAVLFKNQIQRGYEAILQSISHVCLRANARKGNKEI